MNGDILFTKYDLIHGSHVKDTSSARKSKPRKGDSGRVGGHKTQTFPCQNYKPNPQVLVSLGGPTFQSPELPPCPPSFSSVWF